MSVSHFKNELDRLLAHLGPKISDAPWENREFYANWLAQTTYFVKHSSRLLTLAAAHCSQEYQPFHLRFLAHAAEEKGHEKLSEMDLKNLGRTLSQQPEFGSTKSLYQVQYYWVQFKNPLAFFGYVLCLECIALERGKEVTARVEKAFGPKAAHFIRVHAAEDVDHVKSAMEAVEKMPPESLNVIIENMKQAFANYEHMIEECRTQAAANKAAA